MEKKRKAEKNKENKASMIAITYWLYNTLSKWKHTLVKL